MVPPGAFRSPLAFSWMGGRVSRGVEDFVQEGFSGRATYHMLSGNRA